MPKRYIVSSRCTLMIGRVAKRGSLFVFYDWDIASRTEATSRACCANFELPSIIEVLIKAHPQQSA